MSQISEKIRREFKESDEIRDAGLTTPDNIRRFDDLRYGTDADCQRLDVYRPKSLEGQKLPVIVSVHGGGWVYGDKERYQYYCMSLAQRGFAVVNFTYRLAPEHKFPAPLEDTNKVVEWILDNQKTYALDAQHVFFVGDSAGAHTLGLYAAICTNPAYARNYSFAVPKGFRPGAIALNCGTYRNLREEGMDEQREGLLADYLPQGGSDEELRLICVPNHITEDYVPTCIMTATGDFLIDQAVILQERLLDCRIPFEFQFWGDKNTELGHVFHVNMKLETAAICNDAQCAFFRRFLGNR